MEIDAAHVTDDTQRTSLVTSMSPEHRHLPLRALADLQLCIEHEQNVSSLPAWVQLRLRQVHHHASRLCFTNTSILLLKIV